MLHVVGLARECFAKDSMPLIRPLIAKIKASETIFVTILTEKSNLSVDDHYSVRFVFNHGL